jgi:hypothetical protein
MLPPMYTPFSTAIAGVDAAMRIVNRNGRHVLISVLLLPKTDPSC